MKNSEHFGSIRYDGHVGGAGALGCALMPQELGDASGISDTITRITALARHEQGAKAQLGGDTSDDSDTMVGIPARGCPIHERKARAARDTSGEADAIDHLPPSMHHRTPSGYRRRKNASGNTDTMAAEYGDTSGNTDCSRAGCSAEAAVPVAAPSEANPPECGDTTTQTELTVSMGAAVANSGESPSTRMSSLTKRAARSALHAFVAPCDSRREEFSTCPGIMLTAARIDRMVCWTLLLGAVWAAPLAAQKVVVRVVANGVPVASVEVSLWGESARLASAYTSDAGLVSFVLTGSSPREAYVTARRIGFAPGRAFADADTVTVALAATATPLPVLAVKTRALRCPVDADTTAVRLWQAAAARYGTDQRILYFGYVGNTVTERVAADERGYGTERGDSTYGVWTPAAQDPQLEQRPPVYASYVRSRNMLGEFKQWMYAPLGRVAAWHFATTAFAESHTLTVLGRTQDATILGFCPTNRREADVQGELEVGDGSFFRAARWWFRVPHDDEDAGGEATFGIGHFGGRPYLVAIRGSQWRRADRHHYEQARFELAAWRLGTSVAAINAGWTSKGDVGAALP